jgi:hypothetical protein
LHDERLWRAGLVTFPAFFWPGVGRTSLGQDYLVRRSGSPRYGGGGPSPKAGMSISPTPFLLSARTTPLWGAATKADFRVSVNHGIKNTFDTLISIFPAVRK